MDKSVSNHKARGLTADVNAEVVVEGTGSLKVRLRIEADNGTDDLIELTEPYPIPLSTAYGIDVRDKEGDLHRIYGNGILEIHFRKGTTLPPGKKYWWIICFGTDGYLKPTTEGNIIIGPYSIEPQTGYKNIPIRNHRFTYKFLFEKPKPRRAWPFKTNYIFQVNNRKIAASQKRRFGFTECNFEPFHLEPSEYMRIYFTRVYRFSSKLIAMLAFLITAVIGAIVHSIVCFKG